MVERIVRQGDDVSATWVRDGDRLGGNRHGLTYRRSMPLKPGDKAPAIALSDQSGNTVKLSDFKGRKVLVFFYPKADTPGCTTQACGMRDILGDIGDTAVLGISPDKPAKQAKFDEKYGLGLPAARRRGPRGRRGLRRVGREVDVRQEVHGHHPLGVPRRREGQDRGGLAQDQPEGHPGQPAQGPWL